MHIKLTMKDYKRGKRREREGYETKRKEKERS